MQDLYETLQVHPKADQEAIDDAYQRLRERYAPAKLEGAADELVEIARRKRDELDHAYAVLGDPVRRANYDTEQVERQAAVALDTEAGDLTEDDLIDYRPLPPAKGQERGRSFDVYPLLSREEVVGVSRGRQAGRVGKRLPLWAPPVIIVAVVTFLVMVTSLIVTNGGQMRYASDLVDAQGAAAQNSEDGASSVAEVGQLIAEYDGQVVQARQVALNVPDNPEAWVQLGNALYDSVQVVREITRDGPIYLERVERWLEASDAYATAIELGLENPEVLSDRGVSLCYYGEDTAQPDYVVEGLEYTTQAVEQTRESGRVLLNLGICKIGAEPPQTAEAVALWQEVLALPDTRVGVAQQARILLEQHGQ